MKSPFPTQEEGLLYLTEGGSETEIMYRYGYELPEFAMFTLLNPGYSQLPAFSLTSSASKIGLMTWSILSLAVNFSVFAFNMYTIIKKKRNPLTGELHSDLKSFQTVLETNNL